jgi:hypothetical protein
LPHFEDTKSAAHDPEWCAGDQPLRHDDRRCTA